MGNEQTLFEKIIMQFNKLLNFFFFYFISKEHDIQLLVYYQILFSEILILN